MVPTTLSKDFACRISRVQIIVSEYPKQNVERQERIEALFRGDLEVLELGSRRRRQSAEVIGRERKSNSNSRRRYSTISESINKGIRLEKDSGA